MLVNFSGAEFLRTVCNEFKRGIRKSLSCVHVLTKREIRQFTRGRATTAKKCTKTRDARAKFLFRCLFLLVLLMAEGLKKNLNLGGTPRHQERRESPVAQQLKQWTCNPEAPPWPLAGFVLGSPELMINSSVMFVLNGQLVRLLSAGILNLVMFHLNYLFHYSWSPIMGEGK